MERSFGVDRPAHPVQRAGTGVRGGHGDHALRHARRRAVALRADVGGHAARRRSTSARSSGSTATACGSTCATRSRATASWSRTSRRRWRDRLRALAGGHRDAVDGARQVTRQRGVLRAAGDDARVDALARASTASRSSGSTPTASTASSPTWPTSRADGRRNEDLGGALRRAGARVLPDREARRTWTCSRARRLPGLVLPDQGRAGERRLVAGGGVRLSSGRGRATVAGPWVRGRGSRRSDPAA